MSASSTPGGGWQPLNYAAATALFAITLGIFLQAMLLALRVWADAVPTLAKSASDFAGGVSWATIVCSGVALGLGASRHRERLMGLLGFICAPAAFAMAKGVQRGVESMMGAPASPIGALVIQIGLVKAVEYGLLALVLARLIARRKSTPRRHAIAGLAFGVIGGSAVLALELSHATGPLALAKLLGIAVNELLFPIGCALVIHMVARLSGQAGPAASGDPGRRDADLSDAADTASATS